MSEVSREIARLYDAGNGEALLEHLEKFPLEHYVPIATSLGLYNEAVSVMVPLLREFSTDGFMQALLLVNTAEPLSELGRYDEALELLETPCPFELIEAGRRCTLVDPLDARAARRSAQTAERHRPAVTARLPLRVLAHARAHRNTRRLARRL